MSLVRAEITIKNAVDVGERGTRVYHGRSGSDAYRRSPCRYRGVDACNQ